MNIRRRFSGACRALAVCGLSVGVLACGGSEGPPASEPASVAETVSAPGAPSGSLHERAPGDAPTEWALLVGINTYPNLTRFSQLEGAVNDVERMRALLTTRFGFPPEQVTVLVNEAATRERILAELDRLARVAKAGDLVVFHYSGHGSRLDDQNGDELDGIDETIVPVDSDRAGSRDIRDDEINERLGKLPPGALVTLILDSCYSGTASRDLEGGRSRRVDRDSLLHPTPVSGARGAPAADGLAAPGMSYVLLSGARADQQSKEFRKDGKSFGAMTYFLTETLNEADSAMTYADLRDVVQGRVNAVFANQQPQLEGPSSDLYVFSRESSLAEPYVRADPGEGGRVVLKAGAVHGMTAGSVFEVYAPGVKRFSEPNRALARVRVTHVASFASEAEVLSGGPVPAAARAVERAHVYSDLRMKLRYEGLAASPLLRALRDSLDGLRHIEAVPETSDDFDLRLYERDGRVHLRQDEIVFSDPVPVDEPDALGHLVKQVGQWAKWFNVLALDDAAPEAGVVLHLRIENPDGEAGRPRNEAVEGADLWYAFENRSDEDLFITGIALFSTGAIQPFYPWPPGAGERLKAGTRSREIRIPNLRIPDRTRPYTKDVIKVFATTTPIDLSSLMQGGIRGGTADPLGQLMLQATQGASRDFTPQEAGAWYTTQQAYVIRRR